MNNPASHTSDFFSEPTAMGNSLLQYVQSMGPETIAQLSQPTSKDVMQAMEHHIMGLLGGLPSNNFDVTITTNRDNLGRLMASAMMSGYFLRGAEQRLAFESVMGADHEPVTTTLGDVATDA